MKVRRGEYERALKKARRLAKEGPRVAAIIVLHSKFAAVPGYVDEDTENIKQVALITPDGRVWIKDPA